MCIWEWGGDTVIEKNHKGGLVTLADRLSRSVLAGHIPSEHAGMCNGYDRTVVWAI